MKKLCTASILLLIVALSYMCVASPVTDFNSPNFGRIQSTNRFNRQLQFGVKRLL